MGMGAAILLRKLRGLVVVHALTNAIMLGLEERRVLVESSIGYVEGCKGVPIRSGRRGFPRRVGVRVRVDWPHAFLDGKDTLSECRGGGLLGVGDG